MKKNCGLWIADCGLRRAAACLALALMVGACGRPKPRGDAPPKPEPVKPPTAEAIEQSIQRGVGFLLARQNKDGSWGSARSARPMNVYAPVPGAHQAFRGAVTAMCVMALIEVADPRPEAVAALDRGELWLEAHLADVRRATADTMYNVWTHAYGIQALVRMIGRHTGDAARKQRLAALIEGQIGLLGRYEAVDGGWGYYDFRAHTQKPSGSPNSFVTASVLIALREAEGVGVAAPPKLVERALACMHRQQNPDFTYLYSEPWKWHPVYGINRPAGSLGRSQACNLALRLWGDPKITDAVLETWLDRLFARNEWLGMGRKRPIPHESWFQVAAYFYYYGHYYAALCLDQLPPRPRRRYQGYMAHTLLQVQEKDGSWWDFPLYDYHQQYGTAFALMALARCRPG